jgi:hypothetical protein
LFSGLWLPSTASPIQSQVFVYLIVTPSYRQQRKDLERVNVEKCEETAGPGGQEERASPSEKVAKCRVRPGEGGTQEGKEVCG